MFCTACLRSYTVHNRLSKGHLKRLGFAQAFLGVTPFQGAWKVLIYKVYSVEVFIRNIVA